VVGIVALPLSMALAIASGVPPQVGLYTAIVAGVLVPLLGGSRWQVTGPTAAFVVVLAPIAARFGLSGLLVATVLAGLMLIAMGLLRLGKLIEFVPYPVTTGFTAGIGVVIATLQVKDLLGLTIESPAPHFVERLGDIALALPTTRLADVAIAALTLAVLLLWPKLTRKVPSPLVALVVAAGAAWLAARVIPGFHVATIRDRFAFDAGDGRLLPGIPRQPPLPVLPWRVGGTGGPTARFSFDLVRTLLPPAFAIAILGAIESLLSATIADGMKGTKHDPDAELVAQGIGNVVAPFFGGIAATGAIARTATGIRSGARTPLASAIHGVIVLAAMLALAPALGYLPMAALAALLLVVAWNMSEPQLFVRLLRGAPRADAAVLLACFGLTVVFDMTVAVTAGMLLSMMLFIKRMSDVFGIEPAAPDHPALREPLPAGIVLYEVAGPLFFGAAAKAVEALETVDRSARVVVLDLSAVPAIDATGIVHLEAAIEFLRRRRVAVILAGLRRQPARALVRSDWRHRLPDVRVVRRLERGIELARAHVETDELPTESGSGRTGTRPNAL
jgi:SulP family sulfate permease